MKKSSVDTFCNIDTNELLTVSVLLGDKKSIFYLSSKLGALSLNYL